MYDVITESVPQIGITTVRKSVLYGNPQIFNGYPVNMIPIVVKDVIQEFDPTFCWKIRRKYVPIFIEQVIKRLSNIERIFTME